MSLPEHDKSYMRKREMKDELVVLLGGRVAESIFLDDISTGASNDIERATKIARDMVTRYGFSEKLGTIVYGQANHEVFLGRDFNQSRNYSENVAAEIDAEIRDIIDSAYEQCHDILEAHRDQMVTVAEYLIGHEKIDGEEFKKLMTGELKAGPVVQPSTEENINAPKEPVPPKGPVRPGEISEESGAVDLPNGEVDH